MHRPLVLDLLEVSIKDSNIVGGKNASIGELMKSGIRTPIGFAITAFAYDYFLEHGKLREKIEEIIKHLDFREIGNVNRASARIRNLIEESPFPIDLEEQIISHYRELGRKLNRKDPEVAVRSSATAEDLPDASFAGQQDTYLFVSGEENVLKYVKKCFSSIFTPRAMIYRQEKGFDHLS
jgi:Phosphoenolpyruvate synthase/pyruvate phosphate dikinase